MTCEMTLKSAVLFIYKLMTSNVFAIILLALQGRRMQLNLPSVVAMRPITHHFLIAQQLNHNI